MHSPAVHPADPRQWLDVLEVLFQSVDARQRPEVVSRTAALLRTGEIDPGGLMVAWQTGTIRGAMLSTPAPGALGLVWPPQAIPEANAAAVQDALIHTTLAWLREQGAKLAQALLPPETSSQADPLLRHGFRRVTTLEYLRHALSSPSVTSPATLRFEAYDAENAQRFAHILERTYVGTHDCPEVNGVRTIDEVLAGHRAQGNSLPRRWWLAWDAQMPIGVLLVDGLAERMGWEIVYMGVIPEARGHGYGRQLTQHALHAAQTSAAPCLELCVDHRNLFARHVYHALGFETIGERVVFLGVLQQPRSPTSCDVFTR